MKIRWYEVLILLMTGLCVLIFLCTYFSTVRAPGVWISTERGEAYQSEAGMSEGDPLTAESDGNEIIDLNTADLEELMTLPGIGEARAEAILAYRRSHGNFQSVEDLLKVDGIGENLLKKIRGRITV